MHKAAYSVSCCDDKSHFLCGCLAETRNHLCQQLRLIGLFEWLKVIYGMVVLYRKKKKKVNFSFQSHGHPFQIRLKPLLLLKYYKKLFFRKHVTCWACKCHTITSRKQESQVYFHLVIADKIPLPAKERETLKFTKSYKNKSFSWAWQTQRFTVFSWRAEVDALVIILHQFYDHL